MPDTEFFKQQAYIAGHWLDSEEGELASVTNPATGEVIGTVPFLGELGACRT
ncbi:MAG: hypothetical protein ACR2PX_18210 [Endozoicomonas sp.]|uniref:hypothetical protein n=1 Tax=Endozoicomonas sp. TaxID=1892382 RepID=UPI003D9ADDE2